MAASRTLGNHSAFRQRLVLSFYLPKIPAKKKSQDETGLRSEEEPKQGEQGPDHKAFFWLHSVIVKLRSWCEPSFLSGVTKLLVTRGALGRGERDQGTLLHTSAIGVDRNNLGHA